MTYLKNHDRVAGLAIFAAALFLYDHSSLFPKESQTFPRIILVAAMVFSGWMVLRSIIFEEWRDKEFQPFFVHFGRFAITVVSMGVYIVAVEAVGYYTASVIYIPVAAWLLGYRSRFALVLATVSYIVFAFLVFDQLFELRFPQEFFLRG